VDSPFLSDVPPDAETVTRGADEVAFLHQKLAALHAEVEELRGKVTALCALERFRDVVLRRHEVTEYAQPKTGVLDARDFMDAADGVWFLEYNQAGIPYRWTGPGHFTRLRFHVDRTAPLRLRFHFISLGRNGAGDRLSVDIDNAVHVLSEDGSPLTLATRPVAPRAQSGPTDVFLHVPVLFSPSESGLNDMRTLGVALARVEVEPA
jgi:hypothetical protein